VPPPDAPLTRYDLDREAWVTHLAGQPRYRIDQIWRGLYERGQDLGDLPAGLRSELAEELPSSLELATEQRSRSGDTVKWLWRLHDGAVIETVLMVYDRRATVCISTQAGCAMACGFCATGQVGFDRQLTVGEIVEQVVLARRAALPQRVSNVVFMGMGEPLANYDATWAAVERLHGAVGLSARHLTISTVGIVPGIRRLASEPLPVNLAVSLHAANDTLRNELVPINRRYPLAELAEACADHVATTGRRLSFEWAMIAHTNDRASDAAELAPLARALGAHINLIPLNPTPGYRTVGSTPAQVRWFRDELVRLGANATVRQNRGTDIDAACGQLRAGQDASSRKGSTQGDAEARLDDTQSTPLRISPRRGDS
jgi:23S rRNA (adenine2503-C2)-methyltransferase